MANRKPTPRPTLGVVDDLALVVSNSLTTPSFILSVVFSIAVVSSHLVDDTSGPLHWVLSRFADHKLAQLVAVEIHRFLGLVAFVPIILNSPAVSRVAAGLAVLAMVTIVPVQSQYVYACAALVMHMYLHAKLRATRVTLVASAIALAALVYAETRVREEIHHTAPSRVSRSQPAGASTR